jgi:hypothetical protein
MNKNLMNFRIPLTHAGAVGRQNPNTGSGAVLIQDSMKEQMKGIKRSNSLKYSTALMNPSTKS